MCVYKYLIRSEENGYWAPDGSWVKSRYEARYFLKEDFMQLLSEVNDFVTYADELLKNDTTLICYDSITTRERAVELIWSYAGGLFLMQMLVPKYPELVALLEKQDLYISSECFMPLV